jgi:hypothetical protein
MKRCDFCGGRFGLVSYRYFRKRFCRKGCRENYFAALAQNVTSKRRRLVAVVAKPSAFASFLQTPP